MITTRFSLSVWAGLVLFAAPRAHADVIDVRISGGDTNSLAAAVGLAADGDTLLVQPGDYTTTGPPFSFGAATIDGKALTIVADGDGVILGALTIRNLAAGQVVLLRGVRVPAPAAHVPAVLVQDCAGEVWIEDADLTGHQGFPASGGEAGTPALRVLDSHEVLLVRCELRGGDGADASGAFEGPGPGGAGVEIVNASVQLHECVATGGEGGSNPQALEQEPGEPGGAGLRGDGAALLAAGAVLQGGAGGAGGSSAAIPGGRGGHGLHLQGAPSVARLVDLTSAGGGGGPSVAGPADDGQARFVPDGLAVDFAGPPRLLEITAPARESGPAELSYQGVQGDLFLIFLSVDTAVLPLPGKHGTWMLAPPFFRIGGIGTVTAVDGQVALPFSLATFADPGLENFDLYVQVFAQDTQGRTRISNACSLIAVDEAF